MDKEDIQKKISEDPDYVRSPKFNNSLAKFKLKYSNGVNDKIIARLLMTNEEHVKRLHDEAVAMLGKWMKR